MKTLSIQNGDLHLDEKGNLVSVTELEALRQRIEEYLKMIKGEWALDLTRGLPYMEDVFKVGVVEADVRQVFDSAIRSFSEVVGVTNSLSLIDTKLRTYKYAASVSTEYGETEIVING